jgi:hypothetical protein
MPTSYQECPESVKKLCKAVMLSMHPKLIEADATLFLAFATNHDGPAIMHGGYPAAAQIRINNLRDRVAGLADATMLIDSECWEGYSEESRAALIDHELTHLNVKLNKVGAIAYDDANRPRLTIRKHDFQIGGFHEIAKRHGVAAIEVAAVADVNAKWRQMAFEFAA